LEDERYKSAIVGKKKNHGKGGKKVGATVGRGFSIEGWGRREETGEEGYSGARKKKDITEPAHKTGGQVKWSTTKKRECRIAHTNACYSIQGLKKKCLLKVPLMKRRGGQGASLLSGSH